MQNEAVALLRCPICSGSFHQEGKSLLCEKRHCYDIARQGHVNFAPNAKQSFYKKELFESREKVFEAGVFAPVVAAVGKANVFSECHALHLAWIRRARHGIETEALTAVKGFENAYVRAAHGEPAVFLVLYVWFLHIDRL